MDWALIAEAIEQRMRELGLYKSGLALKAGIDRSLVTRLTSGKPWSIREANLGRVERVLGWPVGSIETVGHGGDIPAAEIESAPSNRGGLDLGTVLALVEEMRAKVDALAAALESLERCD